MVLVCSRLILMSITITGPTNRWTRAAIACTPIKPRIPISSDSAPRDLWLNTAARFFEPFICHSFVDVEHARQFDKHGRAAVEVSITNADDSRVALGFGGRLLISVLFPSRFCLKLGREKVFDQSMTHRDQTKRRHERSAPMIPHSDPIGGSGSLEAAMMREKQPVKRFFKMLGPGLITGASDDDPSGL